MALRAVFSFLGFSSHIFFLSPVACHRFCILSYINDVMTANCAYRGQVEIPPDLNPGIKVLILSHNNIERIRSNSFSRYTSLIKLYLNDNILLNNSIHEDAFSPLTNLQILDISFMRYNVPFNLNWPPSIKVLSVSKNRNQYKIDLSSLPELVTLNSADCSLMYFPKFNESASIREIDVSKNPLNDFSVRDLASLCQLENLRLQWTKDSLLNSSERWCDCLKIEVWMNQRRITGNDLNCTKPDKFNSSCNLSFDEENRIFEHCLENSIKFGELWIWKIAFVIIAPILCIICIACLCLFA